MTQNEAPANQGAQILASAIKEANLSINEAGKAAGAPAGCFSRLLSGKRKPGRALAAAIQARFGVPPEAWDAALPEDEEEKSAADNLVVAALEALADLGPEAFAAALAEIRRLRAEREES